MIFDIYEQLSYLSSAFTLEVGDVLSTGTPSGIAWRRPGSYLKPGDVVRLEIDKIGPGEPGHRRARSGRLNTGSDEPLDEFTATSATSFQPLSTTRECPRSAIRSISVTPELCLD